MHNIQNWDKNAMPKAKDMELLRVKNEKKNSILSISQYNQNY